MSLRTLLRVGEDRQIEVLEDGAGPSVVLLPSSLRDSLDLTPFAENLVAEGFRVLRPQPRGMGLSTGPLQDLDLLGLADDVAQVIKALADGPAIVAGHAYGHFVARVTDLLHAEHVRGVALLAAGARRFPTGLTEALDTAADETQPRSERLAALQRAFFAPGNDPTAWLDGWHLELREVYRRAAQFPSKETWWPVANSPILDLQGAFDPWRPEPSRDELLQVLGDVVTVRQVESASHALPVEQPRETALEFAAWALALPR